MPDPTPVAPAKMEPPVYPTATLRIITDTPAQSASAVAGVGSPSSGQPPAGGGGRSKKRRNRNKKKQQAQNHLIPDSGTSSEEGEQSKGPKTVPLSVLPFYSQRS